MQSTHGAHVTGRRLSLDERRFYTEWVLVASVALAAVTLATFMNWTQWLGLGIYDQFQRWFPAQPRNDIVLIAIDDETLFDRGGWPLKRSDYADVFKMLVETGNQPKSVGIDLLFPDPTPEDAVFAARMQALNVVLAIETPWLEGQARRTPENALITRAASSLAHINLSFDPDGSIRGFHLLDNALPQLCLAMSGRAFSEYESDDSYRRFRLVDPKFGFPTASLSDVIDGRVPLQFFKDKYVLIGATAPSLGDHFPTVYSGRLESGTPGVILHANLLNAILSDQLVRPVSTTAQWAASAIVVLLALLALLILSPLAELITSALFAVSALAASCVLLTWGHFWFDPTLVVVGIMVSKVTWAWRRNVLLINFMASRAHQLDKDLSSGIAARSIVSWRQLTTDTVFRYSRLLDAAVDGANKQLSFLDSVISQLPIAVIVADLDGSIVLANSRGRNDLPAELVLYGTRVQSLIDHLGLPGKSLVTLSEQEQVVHSKSALADRDFILRVTQVMGPESTALWVLSLADVTEMQQFQIQRESTLQLLSHDMRTPIAAIMALSRSTSPGPSGYSQSSSEIGRHSLNLLEMMDDFIYSIHAQAKAYALEGVLFETLLDDAIFHVKSIATAKGCRIVLELDEAPEFVLADSRLMTRALVNLLMNAIRYGQSGADVVVRVSREFREEGPPWLCCSVSNIVGELGETNGRSQSSGASFGLGLRFVQTVVQKHQGLLQTELPAAPGALAVVRLFIQITT